MKHKLATFLRGAALYLAIKWTLIAILGSWLHARGLLHLLPIFIAPLAGFMILRKLRAKANTRGASS